MADNYLERKMEEHRSGAPRRMVRKVGAAGSRAGVWSVPFVERRVLVVGSGAHIDMKIVESLRSVGCKVAFMGGDTKQGTEFARRVGAQWHPVDYGDAEGLARSVALICRAWGDIDAIVGRVADFPVAVAEALSRYREDKPYGNPYGVRLIAVKPAMWSDDVRLLLEPYGASIAEVDAENEDAATDCVMLALLHKRIEIR